MNLSIIGSKGSGKGTQIKHLLDKLKLISFSPGDLFRNKRTPLGRLAEKYVQRGELVPDDVVNALVAQWMTTVPPEKGVVFDGFPRTASQAMFLDEAFSDIGSKLDAVVHLDAPPEVIVDRLSGRRVCELCREEFHLASSPFKTCPSKLCEGQHLKQLPLDEPDVILILVKDFEHTIQPVLEYYTGTSRLVTIRADHPPQEVQAALLQALQPFR